MTSQEKLTELTDFSSMQAFESSAKAVPSAIFLRYSNETFYQHLPFCHTPLEVSDELRTIERLDQLIVQGNQIIQSLYTRRSVGNPLVQFLGRSSKSQAVYKAAQPHYDSVLKIILDFKSFVDVAVSELARFWQTDAIWTQGKYSDLLLDRICILFDKLLIMDELHLVKSALTNDLTILQSYIPPLETAKAEEYRFIRLWLSGHKAIENDIVNKLKSHPEIVKITFPIFWSHIYCSLQNPTNLIPEMQYVYLRFMILLARTHADSKFPDDVSKFILKNAYEHPLLPLIYETAGSFLDSIKSVDFLSKLPAPATTSFDFQSLHLELVKKLTELPGQIANYETNLDANTFMKCIESTILLLGKTKNGIREQLAKKVSFPPEDKDIHSPFERSLRKGYSDDELATLLQLIVLWRSLVDLLHSSISTIITVSGDYIAKSLQLFLANLSSQFEILNQSKNKKKINPKLFQVIPPFLDYLVISPELFNGASAALSKKLGNNNNLNNFRSSPSPTTIEFARAFSQETFNSGILNGGECNKLKDLFKDFILESKNWNDFLQLEKILEDVGNQSDLYFKEVQLDLNHVINFPIRASLPFILCEFALNNYMQPELTEKIFYPLGIYDDAAYVAENILHSKILIEEIEAEAEICVKTLSTLISDFTFGSFRSYASLRFLSLNNYNNLFKEFKEHWPLSRAYRLNILLQQNQFYLFLQQIDLKSLIIQAIDEQMQSAIQNLLNLLIKNGLNLMIAVSKGLEILRETHRLLTEQNLGLMPFDNIIQSIIGDTSPNCFISQFTLQLVNELSINISERSYLRSNPLRLIPLNKKTISTSPFGSLTLGKIMKMNFEQTAYFISIDHFNLLIKLLPDGFIARMIALFESNFVAKIKEFFKSFEIVKPLLTRIKDAPSNTPGQLIFDRFEGVYKFFTSDKSCLELFKSMKVLGNMLSIAYLLDISIELKHQTRSEIIGFLKGFGFDGVFHNDFSKIFNREPPPILSLIFNQNPIPNQTDILPPVLTIFLNNLIKETLINSNLRLFEEKSKTILDFTSLTSFGSSWSVLEFIFCLIETLRTNDQESPIEKFGEGVFLCSAAILLITDQFKLYRFTNICKKLETVKDLDFAMRNDLKISKFMATYGFISNSTEWAESVLKPIIDALLENNSK